MAMRIVGTKVTAVSVGAMLFAAGAQAQAMPSDETPKVLPHAAPSKQRPATRHVALSQTRISTGARPRAGRPQGISGVDTARGNAAQQGATAAPPKLAQGTLDLGNGLTFLLNYTSESAANPIGGIRQGTAYAAQLFFGIDADLNRLAGIAGATLHTIVTQRHGRSLSGDFIGNDTSVQEIFGGGQTSRLTLLSYQQKLFDNRLDFEIGRLNGQGAFLISPLYCQFQNNSTCGSPTFIFKNTNFTFFPTSSWAGHAKVWLDDEYKYFFHIGAYEVNPSFLLPTDNGIDFSTSKATGAVIPIEVGYSTTFANDVLPRNYGIGAVIDRSRYNDPVRDVAGGAFVFSGLDPFTQFGRSLVYARFDQMIWRPDPAQPQGLTLFGVAMKSTGGRQIQDYFLELGLVQTGTFRDRPYDTVGFVISNQKYASLGFANIRAARAAQGLDPRDVATNQIMMELNYGIQLNPAARLTPQLQYIINPDQTRFPFRPRPIPDAFVLGAKFSCDLFTLFGYAKGPGSI
ncbi:porin [Methylobacterium sp. Leaf456]|uniref:carbohydrate porin n=1 Tax=Methylobacterium sp. Leaf456 TaxID=1736382 RepID=UPI0006F2E936|nr:carbohydrate porin [Methylobacterium sp. Leaf456]KQT60978.1 porin [Methylobacterium sp. Leaf456]